MGLSLAHKNNNERLNWIIDRAIEADNKAQPPRQYLGGSRLGHSCSRYLQYEYTHTPKDDGKDFSGRILRIFRRGHVFEDLMAEWLRLAGFTLLTAKPDGQQYGFSVAKGRIAGHLDGVFLAGPDWYRYPALWENKALGNKGFNKLEKERLHKAYPVYYGQMQVYMAYMRLTDNPGIFTAVNADSMEIYSEEVPFDPHTAQTLSDKGVSIIQHCEAGELLPRVSCHADHFECVYCEYRNTCWQE